MLRKSISALSWNRIGFVPLVALLCSGCVRDVVRGTSVGRPAAAKAPDCLVRYEEITPTEAQERYQQVGVLCYERPYRHPTENLERLLIDVRGLVCGLGGEVVAFQGYCVHRRASAFELGVYARKTPPNRN